MGTDQCKRTTLVARCCHGAFFGFGFVSTILTLTVMFWIAWCYFGLTILQISDTQRRALVNYSYVSAKPLSTPTTAVPNRSIVVTTQESSINTISKSPTTVSILRGSSRGESQVKVDRRKETAVITDSAKGDFAGRDREAQKNTTKIPTTPPTKDVSVTLPEREASQKRDASHSSSGATAAILSGAEVEESDDRVYARRIFPSAVENRAEGKSESNERSTRRNSPEVKNSPRLDILPTKVYVPDSTEESLKAETIDDRSVREEDRTEPREFVDRDKLDPPRRDAIQSSRRSDLETVYREPDFDREYPRRYATNINRGSSRYDDFDDERGSRGRYDKRERGRESDDRYSKGDTRVYPDDKILAANPSTDEDRYRARERYPDDIKKRGDDDRYDDRYKDYDEKSRIYDKDETRYRDRDLEKPLSRSDRNRDGESFRNREDDKYRSRDDDERYRLRDDRPENDRFKSRDDDRYRLRDDDRYRPRDDDRYRTRDDDRYRSRDDDTYRSRDDDRYASRDDDRYESRDDDRYASRDDGRYRYRDDERYRPRNEDRYRTRDDDKYRTDLDNRRNVPPRSRVEEDGYRLRSEDDKYTDSISSRVRDTNIRESVSKSSSSLPIGDRKPASSRSQHDDKTVESARDFDVPIRDTTRLKDRDDINPLRLSRPHDDRYRDRDDRYRLTRYDEDEDKIISPTRAFSRSAVISSKLTDADDVSRYADSRRDRIRNDRFFDDDEHDPESRHQDSKSFSSRSESSRRYTDDKDIYRTRLPNEKIENTKTSTRREEVVLDHRSKVSEKDDNYRRGTSRTRDYYDERPRSPSEDTRRRYKNDESYLRRDLVVDEELRRDKQKDDNPRDRIRNRERYDDEYRRYDDKYIARDEDRYPMREERLPPPARKYDVHPYDEDEGTRAQVRPKLTDDSEIREETLRSSASSRSEERFYDEYPDTKSSSRRRYYDDVPYPADYSVKDRDSDSRGYHSGSRRPVMTREPSLGSSMSSMTLREPADVITRGKRFQSSDNKYQSSRVISTERSYEDSESDSKEQVRPLSAKDVIEAAIRHSENSDQNSRKVHYPVFDPRVSNLTSPEIIRTSERRGTTITARKRRSS